MAVSFIGEGNRSTLGKPPTCHKSQTFSHNVVSSIPHHEWDSVPIPSRTSISNA